MRDSIKVSRAALDELNGAIILRGVVDPDSFNHLQVDDYQREVRPLTSLQKLIDAYKSGSRIPDIELGMRGQSYIERDGAFYLQDQVYIIDGQQRVSAARHGILTGQLSTAHLGCVVHFDTTKPWERDRFRILNTLRSKVSPNVLLRNMSDDSAVVEMLLNLCSDRSFALRGKVSWRQNLARCELLTARTFLGTVGRLHAHIGPGRSNDLTEMVRGLDTIMERVGRQTMRDNIKTFFDFIDGAWGLRNIAYSEGTSHTKQMFLHMLALLLSDHLNFWKNGEQTQFIMKTTDGKKLASFPVGDPSVKQLSSGSSTSADMLYALFERHFNSHKRTGRLRPRTARATTDVDELEEEAAES